MPDMIDLMDPAFRAKVIDEIDSEENRDRKDESLRRFEIYRERQRPYILEKLVQEFSQDTVQNMRTITSINLTPRIIDEMASIYKRKPMREFREMNDRQKEQVENLYQEANVNVALKQANKIFKLQDQATLMVWPGDGKINVRALHPHHFDVVPDPRDPERAAAYILSVYDKGEYLNGNPAGDTRTNTRTSVSATSDGTDQKIADKDDYQAKAREKRKQKRLIWWSKDFNFMTDGEGTILTDDTEIFNPIGRLPFIDIAGEKDFEFFVRYANGVVEFNLDFGLLLSDTANINRLQGYSQAIIQGDSVPENVVIGPNHVLHLPPNKDGTPSNFQFVTPSPDMDAALSLLELYVKFFLSTKGIDPKTIAGKMEGQSFSSGIERLLAMIEKFEASQDDIDHFVSVEDQLFDLLRAWSNEFQGVTENGLKDSLRLSQIPDNAFVEVQFGKPEIVQTKSEEEDSVIKLMENGLLSRSEAVQRLRETDEDTAKEIVRKIDQEGMSIEVLPEDVNQQDAEG